MRSGRAVSAVRGRVRFAASGRGVVQAVLCAIAAWLASLAGTAHAAGPRWVTGPPYFSTSGQPVVWYTTNPLYFTDPGDLSATVDHAAADALVAAAASVWNVPTSSMLLLKGGQLTEHVSSQDVYLGSNGPVFPPDVSSANYAAIQIAVIYDSDGSVTELLLGQGASDSANCRQNGVTESVDAISAAGEIQHALLILNGRCTGPAAEQRLQLQYQLMRAFGRVLGLGWSQTNDNVFTASPLPTADEINKWPVMHPIDIVCGPYTYQCMPNPFTLRPDDVASISQLYFIPRGTAPAGKVDTLSNASQVAGVLRFGSGQEMQGVNLVVRRHFPASTFADDGPVVSTVTGNLFRWNNGNPVTGPSNATVAQSLGSDDAQLEGGFRLDMVPELPKTELQDVFITMEPINPLYTGQYGIGPYQDSPVTPSGPAFSFRDNGVIPYERNYYDLTVSGSASVCDASGLGSEGAPAAFAASGWNTGSLCQHGISAWSQFAVQANRSLTIEATALDEQGLTTESKLQPLIGVWNAADPTGTLPTVATASTPFNSIASGLTLLNFATPQSGSLRMVVTDERGDGRPDYGVRIRVLYADSISPAVTTAVGGLVTITGTGFRPGMQVTVDGVPAAVVSSTAKTILAIAPPFAMLGAGAGFTADVGVTDRMSGGSTYLSGALSYPTAALPGPTPRLAVLSPTFYVAAGRQVGVSPVVSLSAAGALVPNAAVSWSAVSGAFVFPNGAQSVSNFNGLASIFAVVGPQSSNTQSIGSACASFGGAVTPACAQFTAVDVDAALWTLTILEGGTQVVAATSVLQPVVFQVVDNVGHPVIGVPVMLYQTVTGRPLCPEKGPCPIAETYESASSAAFSDANGLVVVTPMQLAGKPEITKIAASAGTMGFVAVALQKTP